MNRRIVDLEAYRARWPYGEPDLRIDCPAEETGMPLFAHGGISYQRHPILLTEHSHQGYEIHFMIEGESVQFTASGERLEGKGGTMTLVQPGVLHRGDNGLIPKSKLIWLVIDPGAANATRFTPFSAKDLKEIDRRLSSHGNTCLRYSADLPPLHARLEKALQREDPLATCAVRACLVDFLVLTLETLDQEVVSQETQMNPSVAKALRIMSRTWDEPVHVPALAKEVGLSASRFHEVFKEALGTTPADHHLRSRLSMAAELLRNQAQIAIAEVALKTGFSSPRHLATRFKSQYGCSPAVYRDGYHAPPDETSAQLDTPG